MTSRREVEQLLSELIAIDSVNPDLVAGGAGEAAIAGYVAGWLRERDLDVTLQHVADGRANVVARASGSGGGKSLMLNAHLDTVGVAGMTDPFAARVDGSRLYGRGAYDMKGGLAATMLAIAEAHREAHAGDVVLTAVVDEEYASIGTEAIARELTADAAIVAEPTELQLCLAHKGFAWLDITVAGKAAHGSRPDLGIDAIAKMGPVLVGIADIDRRIRSRTSHPLLGTGSLHASLVSGGQELSSYPERCILRIERRTVPGETRESVEGELRVLLERIAGEDPAFAADLEVGLVRQPLEVRPDAPIARAVARACARINGREPSVIGQTGWMDSAILAAAGIPSIVFGPGGAGAHALIEWSDLDQVCLGVDILVSAIADFCT
ncbi:MAG TPA: ArgE/DapE family deacylase [Vicinamibacterales bacterium]|nr:ArgE/DapE family deacylase [Vicinamibacterales bacterium]